ncbi:hypothetical protein MNBD_GAMMA07-1186 [hydrothermal vent metagenome]|uniref:Uncharacterized protein n=1 Tax=hydrothermal vent metagenome TaxID=652676 RepID=A0A3B0WQ80_9ZZZZ
MCLSHINRLFGLSLLTLMLASCATTSGDRDEHGDMGSGDNGAEIDAGVVNDPLKGGLWNKKLWEGAPKPYVDGLKAAQRGQSNAAMKLFRKSMFDFPDFAPAYTNLGLQQLKLNDLTAAKESLNKSLKIAPNDAVVYNHLGVIARMNGKFDTALKHYKKAIELKSDYANAHLNIGVLLDLYLYELKSALKHYEIYQSIISKKDATVTKWIVEIKRRIAKGKK